MPAAAVVVFLFGTEILLFAYSLFAMIYDVSFE